MSKAGCPPVPGAHCIKHTTPVWVPVDSFDGQVVVLRVSAGFVEVERRRHQEAQGAHRAEGIVKSAAVAVVPD